MTFEDSILYLIFFTILNLLLINKISWIAKKINVYDEPDNLRKIHDTPTPLLGGLLFLLIFYF